jgi:hypothetical protein
MEVHGVRLGEGKACFIAWQDTEYAGPRDLQVQQFSEPNSSALFAYFHVNVFENLLVQLLAPLFENRWSLVLSSLLALY